MDDRTLGSFDLNNPLEKLVREVIKMPLRLKFALCVSTNIVHFSDCSAVFPFKSRDFRFKPRDFR